MKKILIIALAGVALASCKKQTNPESVNSPSEINFTTSANLTKGLAPGYAGNSDNFFLNDQIGVYMANSSSQISVAYTFSPDKATPPTTPSGSQKAEAVNYGYNFSNTEWFPVDGSKKLTYPIARFAVSPNRAQLYAYFPFSGAQNSTVAQKPSPDDKGSAMEYNYKADQTKDEDLRNLDIMWASNTGNGGYGGWEASSTPIALEFNHLMTKLNFTISLVHTQSNVTRYLRAIEVKGPEINVQPAEFDVVLGTLTPKTIQATPGSVYYFNGTTDVNTFFTCAASSSGATMTLPSYNSNPARTNNDLLIYPFSQTADLNSFLFYLTEDLSKTYADMDALRQGVTDGEVELYSAPIKGAVTTSGSEEFHFAKNINNVMKVTIDIENPAINITATVKAWENTADQDIEAQ